MGINIIKRIFLFQEEIRMKLKITYLVIPLLGVAIIIFIAALFNSCKKEAEKVMKVKIDSIGNVSETSAIARGTVLDVGNGIDQHGHCWSTSTDPTYESNDNKTEKGTISNPGSFTSQMIGLQPETKYYVKAYVKKGSETRYSDVELSFTTESKHVMAPVVTTGTAGDITATSATIEGNITDLGIGATSVSNHGHCWSSATSTPTIDSPNKTSLGETTSTGMFNSTLVGLSPSTTYYVRAYATNVAGTAYSSSTNFATLPDISVPTVTTTQVSEISYYDATCGGNVTSDGGSPVTARGVCWNTAPNPTLINSCTEDEDGTGIYTSYITDLAINTTYYVRAYATNSVGTGYGDQRTFKTLGGPNEDWEPGDNWIDDRDGKVYATVLIGTQVWMRENLNVGVQITGANYPVMDTIIEKYCYNDNPANCDEYGGLYIWHEMMNYDYIESVRGICPVGWHLPSDVEWMEMESFLGIDESELDSIGLRGTEEAYLLLDGGDAGFDALMAGYRENTTDEFYYEGVYAYFWTTTEYFEWYPIYRLLHLNSGKIGRGWDYTYQAASVRCVKD
jgi:uncharacterized protein (TIGR02145 family)